VGVVDWDDAFRIIDWNPAATRIFGYSREEAIGKRGSELLVPQGVRQQIDALWTQVANDNNDMVNVNENLTKDGRVIVCEWRNTSLIDDEGKFVGVSSLVFDVTERYLAEEELRERERAQAATIEQLSAPVIDVWEGVLAFAPSPRPPRQVRPRALSREARTARPPRAARRRRPRRWSPTSASRPRSCAPRPRGCARSG